MPHRLVASIFLAAVITLGLCAQATAQSADLSADLAEDLAALDAAIEAQASAWGWSGIVDGTVKSGELPIQEATVALWAANSGGSLILGLATTRLDGTFRMRYREPLSSRTILYITSTAGRLPPLRQRVDQHLTLATVLGPAPWAQEVVINERTTVAAGFAVAQFLNNSEMQGSYPGLQVASQMNRHLVDIRTGELGETITNSANSEQPLTLETFNELANLLASCVRQPGICRTTLKLALPLHGGPPDDTFQAVANIAATPWRDPTPLFNLITAGIYQPDLGGTPPSSWVLSLKFQGDPARFAAPANVAVDSDGQLWIPNNYGHEEGFILPDCASTALYKLDPTTGTTTTYTGGGVDGPGYGVLVAPTTDIWVSNFGFKGSTCPRTPASDSISQFTAQGVPLSPDGVWVDDQYIEGGGWTDGGVGWPQGMATNASGDIWTANCNGREVNGEQVDVTIYRGGDHANWFTISDPNLQKPFDVAFDTNGVAWVTGTNSDNVFAFNPDGSQIPGSPFDLGAGSRPMGIASDSRGNVWVSLSGLLELPCPDLTAQVPASHVPLTVMLNKDGIQAMSTSVSGVDPTKPGGITVPWGMAVDGRDNIWVANFGDSGVSSFCGSNPDSCPEGYQTGDALSPDAIGYESLLLDRNTSVTVDSSGNVWLANNWKDVPIQTDPAGDGMVVYLGLASPVQVPLYTQFDNDPGDAPVDGPSED